VKSSKVAEKNKPKYEAKLCSSLKQCTHAQTRQHARGANSWECTVLWSSQSNVHTRHARQNNHTVSPVSHRLQHWYTLA